MHTAFYNIIILRAFVKKIYSAYMLKTESVLHFTQ